jgi:hypothetical protein
VRKQIAHPSDIGPRNRRIFRTNVFTEVLHCLADNQQVVDDSVRYNWRFNRSAFEVTDVSANSLNGLGDVSQPLLRTAAQREIASRSARSSTAGLSSSALITSTGTPRTSLTSRRTRARSTRVASGASSTRKSMSLVAVSSPRATDPKIRASRAPARRRTSRRARRFRRRSSPRGPVVARTELGRGSAVATASSANVRPQARSSRSSVDSDGTVVPRS